MERYKERMQNILPSIETCSTDELRYTISKYGTFVELLSFRTVLGFAYYWIKSEAGKEALEDNIDCEGKESHQCMLNHFLEQCDALPDNKVQKVMREALKPSWKLLQQGCQKNSAFTHIVYLTLAENTSLAFIPWLAEAAKRVGCKDFTYTDVHGEADIKHAQLFEKAFMEEKEHQRVSDEETTKIIDCYFDLMKVIFDPTY